MAAQYWLTPFGRPVNDLGFVSAGQSATTTVKTTALLANGAKLADSTAAALVRAGRVQITSVRVDGGPVRSRNDLVTYDARNDVFQAKLKASQFGWVRRQWYLVNLRILASPASLSVDLGNRFFVMRVT